MHCVYMCAAPACQVVRVTRYACGVETALWIVGALAAVQVVGPHLWKQVQLAGLRQRARA